MKVVWWLLRLFGFGLAGGLLGQVLAPLLMMIPGLQGLVNRLMIIPGLGVDAIPIWCGGIGGIVFNSAMNRFFKMLTGKDAPGS